MGFGLKLQCEWFDWNPKKVIDFPEQNTSKILTGNHLPPMKRNTTKVVPSSGSEDVREHHQSLQCIAKLPSVRNLMLRVKNEKFMHSVDEIKQ